MSDLMMASVALAALNTALALVLGAVYLRNHAQIKSPFTFGLLLFAAFLVIHNGMEVYNFLTMMAGSVGNETILFVESVLQLGGLVALVSATLR